MKFAFVCLLSIVSFASIAQTRPTITISADQPFTVSIPGENPKQLYEVRVTSAVYGVESFTHVAGKGTFIGINVKPPKSIALSKPALIVDPYYVITPAPSLTATVSHPKSTTTVPVSSTVSRPKSTTTR